MATLGSSDIGKLYVHHGYPFYVKVHGTFYHAIPPILPSRGQTPRFVQIYMLDSEEEQIQARLQGPNQDELDQNIIHLIQAYLLENNPFV